MEHFFHGIYNRKEISDKLVELGFLEENYEVQGIPSTRYISNYKDFIIELTSPTKGKIQIQGIGPKDIEINKENSIYYEFYQKIIETLEPTKITNSKSEILYEK